MVQPTVQEVTCTPGNHEVCISVCRRDVTWTKVLRHAWENCDAVCQHMDQTSASHSTLIGADGESGSSSHGFMASVCFFDRPQLQTNISGPSPLSVRQQTPALIDRPSCFIWDVSATVGSDRQPRGWGPANQSHGRFLAQVLCSWRGTLGFRSLAASVTASLDIDGRTN